MLRRTISHLLFSISAQRYKNCAPCWVYVRFTIDEPSLWLSRPRYSLCEQRLIMLPSLIGPTQNNMIPREASPSPSPSFRERQRAMKTHSMPIVPSVNQILAAGNSPQIMSQPSPTGSNGSLPARRSPPATSRISPAANKLTSSTHGASN